MSESVAIASIVRGMVGESAKRARRLRALREAIASGSYRVSAEGPAEALMRTMRGDPGSAPIDQSYNGCAADR